MKILYIIIPCYNEEQVLDETAKRLQQKIRKLIKAGKIDTGSKIVFVDDGSVDTTWRKVELLHSNNPLFGGLKLSRNQGHQNALIAGLSHYKNDADIVISMDADLQDDIEVIDRMIAANQAGAEIVYGVRNDRQSDSKFKSFTAALFYKLMSHMGVESVYNHADYRLMSSRALHELDKFREVNLFLRGIIPLLGFETDIVEYKRSERYAGTSKYPLKKMLNFAIDGITSFSVKPLRLVTTLGVFVSFVSMLVMVYAVLTKLFGQSVDGWAFTIISVWFIGGIQMLSLGVVGEYIGKIYSEVKARPRYIIEKVV